MKIAPVIIVQLIHIEGPMKGEIQEFPDSEISIGRHPSCQVQFPKDMTTISRKHATITREGNRFKLLNQGPNGTFVNGKRLEETYLKDGDVLTISKNGPKVSFLTELKEAGDISTPPPPQPPETKPEIQAEPPKAVPPPPQQRPPAAQMDHKPTAQPPQQKQAESQGASVQKVQVPLVIQLGPTLRSYKEVPVTIGKSPECDFSLNHPSIIDHHAQIFFSQDQYWVKDLTGQQAVSINGLPIGPQAPLNPEDTLALSTSGPRFRFLGGGRLAEIEEPLQEEQDQGLPAAALRENKTAFSPKDQADKVIKGAKNVLDKFLKH